MVEHIQSSELVFLSQTKRQMSVTVSRPDSQAYYSRLLPQFFLAQERRREDGSRKGWADRQSHSETDTQKPLQRDMKKKKRESRRTDGKRRQKITHRQTDREAPNGQGERKGDNRFPIISYTGNIVLLSTVMPISHDWISLLEVSALQPPPDSKHLSTSTECEV